MNILKLIFKTMLWTSVITVGVLIFAMIVELIWMGIVKYTPLPEKANEFPISAVTVVALMFVPEKWLPFKKMRLAKRTKRHTKSDAFTILATIFATLILIVWILYKAILMMDSGT